MAAPTPKEEQCFEKGGDSSVKHSQVQGKDRIFFFFLKKRKKVWEGGRGEMNQGLLQIQLWVYHIFSSVLLHLIS